MNTPFYGQYLAKFEINNRQGQLTINIDKDRQGQGVAYLVLSEPYDFNIFDCLATVEDGVISGNVTRSARLEALHGRGAQKENAELMSINFQLFTDEIPNRLRFSNKEGQQEIPLNPIRSQYPLKACLLSSWTEFKSWVDNIRIKDRNAVFRGVARSRFSLRTSFHRTGRVDLERYRDSDISVFRDLAETIGNLKLADTPNDLGALWSFAQHHGFPTPLLDWTESPYIAAYFAFSGRLENLEADDEEPVRIYYLNGNFVARNTPPSVNMAEAFPRVLILKPSSKGNQRLVFQQGLFLHSNIVDIENYLLSLSGENGTLINAVEMPASLAREVIDELAYMGVSHLSLFPGLDGAAKHAMFRQFYRPDSPV